MNKTLSFVIPVYNEELRLGITFKALSGLQLPRGLTLSEVIFVNDGSTDATKSQILGYKSKMKKRMNIQLVTYAQNRGKGYAIRQGMKKSTADYTLFFDADMSTPLSELSKFMPFITNGTDVIVGTRKNGHSTVIKHQPLFREMLGRGFTKITQLALNVDVTDFTCGFKAFSKKAKEMIFSQAEIDGWGYDAELLFLAKKNGFSMAEKAVLWSNDERTKVKLYKAVPQTLSELITIRSKHSVKPAFMPRISLRVASK